jgi:DNA-directed RNA polymerase specialized sigma24 family protein
LDTVRDTQFKLYSDGRLFDAVNDPVEAHNLAASAAPTVAAARLRLQRVLATLPPDVAPPFLLRSQSGFKLRQESRN